jgi:polyisoprenoid-binding protein YceI
MKIRQTLLLAVLAIVALALAACGGSQSTPEAAAPAAVEVEVQPTEAPAGAEAEMAAEEPQAAEGQTVFTILPDESEARFLIGEVLAGNAITVVGATGDVEGQIVVDYANPQAATMSTIQVDMSTLKTDNGFRNSAIHDMILQTGNADFRHATFEATAITGLPERATAGQSFDVQITGNLTIHGVTREETFNATISPVSETRIEGLASLTVLYADYGVQILRLPQQVASVEEEVTLELEFAAEAQ